MSWKGNNYGSSSTRIWSSEKQLILCSFETASRNSVETTNSQSSVSWFGLKHKQCNQLRTKVNKNEMPIALARPAGRVYDDAVRFAILISAEFVVLRCKSCSLLLAGVQTGFCLLLFYQSDTGGGQYLRLRENVCLKMMERSKFLI